MSHPLKPLQKPALSPSDLLTHLEQRGLGIPDRPAALFALNKIGYYRLLIYMRPLQDPSKEFKSGVVFGDIVDLYDFDRQLRLLCLDAIERIEVALRAAIINEVGVVYGPHFYLERRHFEELKAFNMFMEQVATAKYLAIEHYCRTYNSPSWSPIWAICEALTFGALSHLYSNLHLDNRKRVAVQFGYDETILVSWFRSVNSLRNMCAHHNRVWNFKMVVDKPKSAKHVASELFDTDSFYSRAVVLAELLRAVESNSEWKRRLRALIENHKALSHPALSAASMGFPKGWRSRSFWSV